eukprot:Skav221059  [mRNA]  locus=scaffold3118:59182:61676:+ [translate_table: standard]
MEGGKPPEGCHCSVCLVLDRIRADTHCSSTPVWVGQSIVDRLRSVHGELLDLRESKGPPRPFPLLAPVAGRAGSDKGATELPKPPEAGEEPSRKRRHHKDKEEKKDRKKDRKKEKKERASEAEVEKAKKVDEKESKASNSGKELTSPPGGHSTASSSGIRREGAEPAPVAAEEGWDEGEEEEEEFEEDREEGEVEEPHTHRRARDHRPELERKRRHRDSRSRSRRRRSPTRERSDSRRREGARRPPEPPGPPPHLRRQLEEEPSSGVMHRPAAAKAKAKGKAAAKVVPGRRRGVALHRPAAAPAVGAQGRDSELDKFNRGEAAILEELPISAYKVGALLCFEEASYFGGECQVAGRFRELAAVSGQHRLRIQVTGTTHEDLLKFVTGTAHHQADIHVCGSTCPGLPHDQGLLHAKKGRLIAMEKEADCTWEKNVTEDHVDQLAALREMQTAMEKAERPPGKEGEGKAKRSSSSSSGRKKKKKKDKSKKKKKQKKDSKAETADKVVAEKKEAMRSYGGRSVARKELGQVFGGTGLDPKPSVRKRVLKYAKKKVARKKDTTSSSSGSGSSESGEVSSEEGNDVLMDANKIKMMSRRAPGSLTAMGVLRMQESLTEQEGVWQLQENVKALPAVTLRYVRSSLGSRLSGGALKEAITLASALDLALQGRCAESADMMMQRLKSMERVAQGSSWASAEKMELAPALSPQISSRAEVDAANREAKLDQKAKGSYAAPYNAKGTFTKGKKGKAEEKGQGKGKRKQAEPAKGAANPSS